MFGGKTGPIFGSNLILRPKSMPAFNVAITSGSSRTRSFISSIHITDSTDCQPSKLCLHREGIPRIMESIKHRHTAASPASPFADATIAISSRT